MEALHVNCNCKVLTHDTKLVVVTGGPGAGKTAVLELAKRSLCEHIAVLPEAATIVFGGGFWRHSTLVGRVAAQRAIFHVQRELESIVTGEKLSAVALCDRGTLDGLAYWPNSEKDFFENYGLKRVEELRRYSAVLHLRSPKANQGYNHQNPVRTESALDAETIDGLIFRAWEGHPDRFVIESESNFTEKALKALQIIQGLLPECCKTHAMKVG